MPIGVVLVMLGLPLLAGLLTVAVDRALKRVEHASDALGRGNLTARVEARGAGATELAERFNAMAERVERLVRSRDELVQAVSHELGSPLSRLRFHLELLEAETDRDIRPKKMARELDTLDALVAELLEYIQSDEVALDIRAFEPGPLMSDLAELATLDASEARPIEVALALHGDGEGFADVRLFQRAVENVLRNAVQYASARVVLELTQDEEALHVTVHDDGPGIPDDLRDQVKLPFSRLESDRGRAKGGAGLGLAIVTRIVERHDGRLTIGTSHLGGAAVRTSWPRPV
jgi:signal transduction histidine kinase